MERLNFPLELARIESSAARVEYHAMMLGILAETLAFTAALSRLVPVVEQFAELA